MQADEFRNTVEKILGAEIRFEGHLKKIVENITPSRIESILEWIKSCKEGAWKAESCKNFRDLVAFIYKSSDNSIRGILTKEKNSYFIELFLDKHKYYDLKRKYLGL